MKKIMILGTGNSQTDFICYCKEYGLEVHCCSYKYEGRGIQYADYFEIINITDIDKVEAYALKHNIDLIYSTGSELAMPTISKVSEKLSLPVFVSTKTAMTCAHKHLLREALINFSEYTVDYEVIRNIETLKNWSKLPAIVKPVDNQGQRGITIVEDVSDLIKAFENAIYYSRSKTAIIEEFIDGTEVSVNAYVTKSKPMLSFLTERISFAQYPGGIVKSHEYPISKNIDKNKICQLLNVVLMQLGIENGPVYLQLKINKEGDPKVLEVTARLDGCHLWRLISHTREIHLFEIILKHLLSGKVDEGLFQKTRIKNDINKASLIFFTQPPESLMQRNKHSIDKNAIYLEWYYQEGEKVYQINGYEEKVGYQIKLG